MEEEKRKKIVLGLRIVALVLFTFMFLFGAVYLPFYIKIPEAMILTLPFFSIPYLLGVLDIFGGLK